MTLEFPLAHRELSRLGRSVYSYLLRGGLVAMIVAILAVLWFFFKGVLGEELTRTEFPVIGTIIDRLVLAFQTVIVFLIAPTLAGGLITSEKEDRSLGLLYLTDRGGWQIVLSKFISVFLQVVFLLLTTVPVIAAAAFFGGISIPVVVQRFFLLALSAGAVCAVALFFSTVLRQTNSAVTMTVAFFGTWLGVCVLIASSWSFYSGFWIYSYSVAWSFAISALYTSHPLYPIWVVGSPGTTLPGLAPGIIAQLLLLIAAIVAARYLLPRQLDEPVAKSAKKERDGNARAGRPERSFAELNPIAELAAAAAGRLDSSWLATAGRGLMMFAFVLLCLIPYIGWLFILTALCRDVVQTTVSVRRHGALEDLALLPASNRELARSLSLAHTERVALYVFAILLALGYTVYAFPVQWPILMVYFTIPVLIYFTIAYGGWVGMLARSSDQLQRLGMSGLMLIVIVINVLIPGLIAHALFFARWGPQIGYDSEFPITEELVWTVYLGVTAVIYFVLARVFYGWFVSRVREAVVWDESLSRGPWWLTWLRP